MNLKCCFSQQHFWCYVLVTFLIMNSLKIWFNRKGKERVVLEEASDEGKQINCNAQKFIWEISVLTLLHVQRPLCVLGRLGKGKKKARGERWEG